MPKVRPVPEGYRTVTPYLTIKDAARAIEFYRKAFGAQVLINMTGPEGKLMHAEIKIGDSIVMLSDECPEMGSKSPDSLKGTPTMLYLYVDNVDAFFDKAVKAGAKVERKVEDQFYGDRSGTLLDPFGHRWGVATHVEDVSPDELQRRQEKLFATAKH